MLSVAAFASLAVWPIAPGGLYFLLGIKCQGSELMATADFELLTELRVISERSAVAPIPPEKSIGRRELEDRIAFSLFLVSRIDRVRRSVPRQEKFDPAAIDWDRARVVNDLYTRWLEPIVSKMAALEQEYGKLDGSEDLRARYRDVKLMSRDTDRVKSSIESLLQGKGIPFDRAMEELRNNLL
jgi:hypothetical protein